MHLQGGSAGGEFGMAGPAVGRSSLYAPTRAVGSLASLGTIQLHIAARLETGLSNNDIPTSLTDHSGFGRDPSQAIASFRARYETGVLNGLPSFNWEHTASDTHYDLSASFTCGSALAVVNSTEDPFADFNGILTEAGAADFLLVNGGGTQLRSAGEFGTNLYVDGVKTTELAPVANHKVIGGFHAGTPSAISSWSIGRDGTSSSRAWVGYISEIVVYSEVLTESQLLTGQSILAGIYGL